MSSPIDIMCINGIASVILRNAPPNAKTINLKANLLLSKEGDVTTEVYSFQNLSGDIASFPLGRGSDSHRIYELLKTHKLFFLENNMQEWKTFNLSIDPVTGKVVLNLEYE